MCDQTGLNSPEIGLTAIATSNSNQIITSTISEITPPPPNAACKDKENEKLNHESRYMSDTLSMVIGKTAEVVQKPELTPKTVESESQTDITVTDDFCTTTTTTTTTANAASIAAAATATAAAAATEADCEDRLVQNINIDNNKAGKMCSIAKMNTEEQMGKDNDIEINDQDKDVCMLIGEPEMSLIEIKEKLIDLESIEKSAADSDSEVEDQLKPLITDNHTVIDHQEYYSYNIGHSPHQHIPLTGQYVKHFEPKDSYSSIDSDLSHDRRMSSSHQDDESTEGYIYDCKDSTCENVQSTVVVKEIETLSPSEIPDDQMCEEIVEQVEFYFSDESILRDAFLLKHVRRNKEGFVSLKLISSFKRVRQLTKDWRVVGHAIKRKSRKIELNDLGTKIRRLEPLPSFDETMPSRTIVACDLPVEKLCIEKVSDMFSKCGEIALIRILRPGMGIPVDVRQFMNKYPEMQQKECALVEFVESQAARNALNLNGNFKVYEMVAPKKKTGKKATTVTKMIENYKYTDNNYERSRGGSSGPFSVSMPFDNSYKYNNAPRRNSSEYYPRSEQQYQHQQQLQQMQQQPMQQSQHIYPPRKYSFNNNNNNNIIKNNNVNNNNNNITTEMTTFGPYSPRRISGCSIGSAGDHSRKYSSCSEGYSSCSELSRRTSTCSSDQSRRTSNCSDFCPCSRRMSQCSDIYRRMSQCSEHNHIPIPNRRYSNSSVTYSNQQDMGRRISMESNYERKISTGSMGSNNGNGNVGGFLMHENCRKFSNGFDPNRKLSNSEQHYISNGRRISTDSGYDRKLSFGSDYGSSPRSRSNSFLMCQHKNVENVVRTPIGPDGSKGFTSRTRKLGQIVPPV